jgi:antirestriction protein ArdC
MNIYETVTTQMIWQLESGVIPWRRNWTRGIPKSLPHGKEYRGVNILTLANADFTSRYWVTCEDATRLGGQVRKGQKPTAIVLWKWHTAEELAQRRQATGNKPQPPCTPMPSVVFNLDQIKGLKSPPDDQPIRRDKRIVTADQIYDIMPDKPSVIHMVTDEAAYNPNADQVIMPHLSQFESAEEYYATLFQQMVSATGHQKRLNRFGAVKGGRFEPYSSEELVAELGAAFLCAFAGIPSPTLSAENESHLFGWAKVLRDQPQLIVRAAASAQKAADYIRGKLPTEIHGADSELPRPRPSKTECVATFQSVLA